MAPAARSCEVPRMTSGACLCGAIEYEVDGPFRDLIHCHCSMCRKHHGAPFGTYAVAPNAGFRWKRGEAEVVELKSSSSGVRRFCKTCSAKAPTIGKTMVAIPAGNLIGPIEAASVYHVFVGSKAPWHVIADDLPKHDGPPPGWPISEARPEPPQIEGAIHGSCLCGDVTFAVRGQPARWMQCHCSRCRRGRSAAHGSNTFFPRAQFEWRTGQAGVQKFKLPEAERFAIHFCGRCGGATPVEREGVPFILVPAGLFDSDPGARPQAHIHVASKAPWYTIADNIPQYPELPPP
jgi:hypothetical protein